MSAFFKTLFGDIGTVSVVVIIMTAEVLFLATPQTLSPRLPSHHSCSPAPLGSRPGERIRVVSMYHAGL